MKQFFKQVDFGTKLFDIAHRQRTETEFEGYCHFHQSCELLYIHRGTGHVIVNEENYPMKPGMLYYFQPYELHLVHAETSPETPYERTIFSFDPVQVAAKLKSWDWMHGKFQRLWFQSLAECAFDLSDRFAFVEGIFDMSGLHKEAQRHEEQEERTLLLLMQLMTCIDEKATPLPPAIRVTRYSEQIMQWIEQHYAKGFDLDMLAEALHLSKSYCSRVFRQETGSSITEYVNATRIRHACRLLQTTSKSVEWVGSEVGLGNTSYFCQTFKKVTGISPHKYRTRGVLL
ncbi:hypothetical protein SY83_21980 [Paenibacillus swuensis]|uniref:HTH araC/xylS-type domain-containing protein n=1 Tax=Paenibacillus swuensis TaxID=1178515 RepID=A0A172TN43_9BACL|nr:AraC family transcriptional regulator [Paenibacillus swuensis]ANE48509.1 hypothetical protein SY83_21980 [Paenibacillus swuensis]